MAQMIAIEVGLTCGFCKPKKEKEHRAPAPADVPTCSGDGVQELILANLGGHT